jgi:hypothetical protein
MFIGVLSSGAYLHLFFDIGAKNDKHNRNQLRSAGISSMEKSREHLLEREVTF